MINLYMLCADLKNSQSNMRQQSNNIIYEVYTFLNNPSKKTQMVIEAWKDEFSYVYGDVNSNISSNSKLHPAELFAKYGIEYSEEKWTEEIQLLFFAIQTYFSVLIKSMMKEILYTQSDENKYESIILGTFAKEAGITNYIYEDCYCWPLFEISSGFAKVMDSIMNSISSYKKNISVQDFVKNNNYDYIKQMYEAIIPKELRHALGEYYTPDWLAECTLRETCAQNYVNVNNSSFIDPTCGSGTFVFKTILLKRECGASLDEIISSVYGFDINPLAVLTAKTNYLLSILDLLNSEIQVNIPIYNVDVVKMGDEDEEIENLDFLDSDNPAVAIKNRILQDRIAAKQLNEFDVIIGNPPWVNWEYMPEKYRHGSQHKWTDYCLFNAKGRYLSFSKEDISVLITYIVIDRLLKDKGILGFVIRQGVFKSAQNGVGFRRFKIKDESDIKVLRVDDLSKVKAFDNATNSTALFYARKGEANEYPVPYYLWEKRNDLKKYSFADYSDLQEVMCQMTLHEQGAIPAVEDDKTSIWVTSVKDKLDSMSKILGANDYRARTGVFTGGANAVYWLSIEAEEGNFIEVINIVERAKRKVESVRAKLEKDYVFPMLKGSNVKKWNVTYDTYLLCPHTIETKMWPVSQEIMKDNSPETYNYLMQFKDDLDGRKGFAGWEKEIQKQEFHAILRIGDYTFSKYKVIWKYIASEFVCAVISTVDDEYLGNKMLLPNEKIMYVSFDDEVEAYYLCGILSSTYVAECVKSYMNPTSISAHVLNKLNIPNFDANNTDHIEIARLCKEGHGKKENDEYIEQIDVIIEKIYSLV
ncbi:N-6 DNA methylase [uncultured Phascolarctobacterium sp.]|uniref:Eco57I restriction-modification methylase domain-containing protein n=1 Tax=Phascolarctobacterium faecium TaxID=33025 RepID=UPI0025FD30A1|nr:N-6 DNA methylase [uncultured Phascolarctobacterium sp.]